MLTPRHSELVLLLTEHPEGLTADAAAVLLHEQDPPSVTVRAELSRLRSQVPELGLMSRPYRLGVVPRTDVTAIHELLDRGRLREALSRCPGPVLPASQAPEVLRLRDELRAHLRAAVIERGDAALLLQRAQDARLPRRHRALARLPRRAADELAPARPAWLPTSTSWTAELGGG